MSHTPGPWRIQKRTTRGEFVTETHIVSADQSHIALVAPCAIEANAHLIAAAPEMLAVLEQIVGQEKPNRCGYDAASVALDDAWRERARAVLVKAKGENL